VKAQNASTQYYAHSREGGNETEWQLLKDHLTATSELAAEMGEMFGIVDLARVVGLLHDIGKYSQEFQARLRGSKKTVDHATAGAREIVRLFPEGASNVLAEIVSFCIAGHHTGLPDYGSSSHMGTEGTLLARREKKDLPDYSSYKEEIEIDRLQLQLQPIRVNRYNPGFTFSFLTRMLFSVLVDADWLETERYIQGRSGLGNMSALKLW
jgi:CRISPR-associated endonuclease/helicase Cas3